MRVLLVEDDLMIGEAVRQALHDAGHSIAWVRNGTDAISREDSEQFNIVLLDLGLPTTDGIDVLRSIRVVAHGTPILIITARDSFEERARGLDLGADDYLVKPFAVPELLARMRAVTRRGKGMGLETIGNGTVSVDRATKEALLGKQRHRLTHREFALLLALLQRPGVVLSRTELEQQMYGWEDAVDSNAIEYIIHSLRKKLGMATIKNVRGLGWMVDRAS